MSDPHGHILKVSGLYLNFLLIYKNLLQLGDHGHVRSRQNEVRLDQVKVGLISDVKGPIYLYPEGFRSIYCFLAYL